MEMENNPFKEDLYFKFSERVENIKKNIYYFIKGRSDLNLNFLLKL